MKIDDARKMIAEAREKVEKATEGPWGWTPTGEKSNGYMVGRAANLKGELLSGRIADGDDLVEPVLVGEHEASTVNYGDADFISAARTDIPLLADIAEAALEVVEAAHYGLRKLPSRAAKSLRVALSRFDALE